MLRIVLALVPLLIGVVLAGAFNPIAAGSLLIGFIVGMLLVIVGALLLAQALKKDRSSVKPRKRLLAAPGIPAFENTKNRYDVEDPDGRRYHTAEETPSLNGWRSQTGTVTSGQKPSDQPFYNPGYKVSQPKKGFRIGYALVGLMVFAGLLWGIPFYLSSLSHPTKPVHSIDPTVVAVVSAAITPNGLGVTGGDLRSMPNPQGAGSFVYVPGTQYNGIERKLIWFVKDGSAVMLNGATANVTPHLPFAQQVDPRFWVGTNQSVNVVTRNGLNAAFDGGEQSQAEAAPSTFRTGYPSSRPPCSPTLYGGWSYDCVRLSASTAISPVSNWEPVRYFIQFDGEEFSVTVGITRERYRRYRTDNPPTIALMPDAEYVADPNALDSKAPARLKIGSYEIQLEWDGAPHWFVPRERTQEVIGALSNAVRANVSTKSVLKGIGVPIPVDDFSSALEAIQKH